MDIPPPYIPDEPRKRKSKISVDMLMQAVSGAWSRFPVTMLYIAYTTAWAMIFIINDKELWVYEASNVTCALWYLGGVGIPLTLAVSLWCEYLSYRSWVPMIVANLLLVIDTIYIMVHGSDLSEAWSIGRIAIVTSLVVAVIFLPSRKSWAWNFSNSQVVGALTSTVFSWAFCAAIGIIFLTIFGLFNVESLQVMFCFQVLGACSIPLIIFLHLIPRTDEVTALEHGFKASRFQCGTAKFFFLLLTVVYMAILYVYGLKILFTWELPRGIVTWSVTGLTVAVLVTLFLLEGVRRTHPDDSITLLAIRWLPIAILPLFVLMSVGLLYRICEYGLTVSRLYVLTFNLWCYIVFGYMIISRPRRFNGIAISFAVVFLLTSIFPYVNYTNLADQIMRTKLRSALQEMGFSTFPVGEKEFAEAFASLPRKERIDVESKVKYLDSHHDHSLLEDITGATYYGKGDSYISEYFLFVDTIEDTPTEVIGPHRFVSLKAKADFVTLPQGYSSVEYRRMRCSSSSMPEGNEQVVIGGITYRLPVDSLIQLDNQQDFSPVMLHTASGNPDTVYVAREIEMSLYSSTGKDKTRELSSLELVGFTFAR
ncbi:MAG: DUF4153 domain-containing protein [Paenibacillus sp.]|nr:DUF4153 domain-containing protein [Paenibacillus sp.]